MIHKLAKYYNVLGLTTSATQKEIKRAYFKLAKEYHPDVNPTEEAKQKFIEVNEAYEFLSDPQKIRNLLYKYAAPKKAQQNHAKKREQTIKKKTTQKAKVTEPEFERIVDKETLKKDLGRIGKMGLSLFIFGTIIFLISYNANLDDPDSKYDIDIYIYGYSIFTTSMCVLFLIFASVAYTDYIKFKQEHNQTKPPQSDTAEEL